MVKNHAHSSPACCRKYHECVLVFQGCWHAAQKSSRASEGEVLDGAAGSNALMLMMNFDAIDPLLFLLSPHISFTSGPLIKWNTQENDGNVKRYKRRNLYEIHNLPQSVLLRNKTSFVFAFFSWTFLLFYDNRKWDCGRGGDLFKWRIHHDDVMCFGGNLECLQHTITSELFVVVNEQNAFADRCVFEEN